MRGNQRQRLCRAGRVFVARPGTSRSGLGQAERTERSARVGPCAAGVTTGAIDERSESKGRRVDVRRVDTGREDHLWRDLFTVDRVEKEPPAREQRVPDLPTG